MPKKTNSTGNSNGEMPISEHLRELRNRVAVVLVVFLAAALIGLRYAPGLVTVLLDIGKKYNYVYVYISPQELLVEYFSVALKAGIVLALPIVLYETWAFVKPGLKKSENLYFMLAMFFGTICFCMGVFFAYRIMLPFMLYFLITLSDGSGVAASISVQNYITFLMTIFMIFGAVFELPVVSVLLTAMGLLRVEWMKKGWRIMIVVIFIVAALITPPDVMSQIMVALPMLLLYEISILLCTFVQKIKIKDKKKG